MKRRPTTTWSMLRVGGLRYLTKAADGVEPTGKCWKCKDCGETFRWHGGFRSDSIVCGECNGEFILFGIEPSGYFLIFDEEELS